MTFAWYWHLKAPYLPLWKVILISWGPGFNRILPGCSCKPHWFSSRMEWFSTKDHRGGDHGHHIFRFCSALPERTSTVEVRC
jgi:hypothetical protein